MKWNHTAHKRPKKDQPIVMAYPHLDELKWFMCVVKWWVAEEAWEDYCKDRSAVRIAQGFPAGNHNFWWIPLGQFPFPKGEK